jgi:DNA-binding transcriptional regulator YhcF (GntR family)
MLTSEMIQQLRGLKKNFIVLAVLYLLGRPAGETEIAEILDINPRTARAGLRSLEHAGYIRRERVVRGYSLTELAQTLFFFQKDGRKCRSLSLINNNEDLKQIDSLSSLINTGTSKKHQPSNKTARTPRLSTDAVDNSVENPVDNSSERPAPISTEMQKAFAAAGIHLNRRTRAMAALDHVTPDYVIAHHQSLVRRGLGDHTGLLIKILEDAQPAPPLNERGHPAGCSCRECQRSAYLEWES